MTKTETRVLAAMQLIEQYEGASLVGIRSIVGATGLLASGRMTERTVYNGLQKLTERGLIERVTVSGLGGGMTLYRRTEA